MDFDRAVGLYYVCSLWHSGGGSRGYRLLSRLNVRHGSDRGYRLLPRDEWADARRWAAHYTRLARKHPRMF